MTETFRFTEILSEKQIEEEMKKEEEEEEEARRNPSRSFATEHKELRKELRRWEWRLQERKREWTEEEDPQLLFKYRLRNLEKKMAAFQYVLKSTPDPVRQELEKSGFVQETKTLRKNVRSLLTCEGVSHVTVAQLKDELGEDESDNYMDRSAARNAVYDFSRSFLGRLVDQSMRNRMSSMDPMAYRLQNTTRAEDHLSMMNAWEDRKQTEDQEEEEDLLLFLSPEFKFARSMENSDQLKDQVVEDRLQFATHEVKFEWTSETVMRLWKATKGGHRKNPELAAVLFQESPT